MELMNRQVRWFTFLSLFLVFPWLSQDAFPAAKGGRDMQITSVAFTEGGIIPPRFTCDGEDISPPLAWKDVPAAIKSLVLVSDDPDAPAGTWVHWGNAPGKSNLSCSSDNRPMP